MQGTVLNGFSNLEEHMVISLPDKIHNRQKVWLRKSGMQFTNYFTKEYMYYKSIHSFG
ncbi:hypothetical protein [Macrococcoides goetzii]|uniref:hypothetical protein n=1 Tax=Macrococcoides goetzii TaxID=1891097 RepID=UPI0013147D8E|nr:hypothetical protein [Macrococcus goetzii]